MADNDIDPDIDLDPAPEPDNEPEPEPDDEPEAVAPDVESDDEDGQPEPEPDLEEYELDGGLKFRGPKALKDHILRQSDYTKKTQAVAEKERQLEADREAITAIRKADREYQVDLGRLAGIEEQLSRFTAGPNGQMVSADDIDWAAWHRSNPQAAQQAERIRDGLERQRDRLRRTVDEAKQRHESEAQQETARRIQAALSFAEKEIPGWSEQRYKDIVGLVDGLKVDERTARAIADNLSPGLVQILDLALDGQRTREARKARQAKTPPVRSNVTPISTVGTRSGGNISTKSPEKMSQDEYVRWRKSGGGDRKAS